MKVGVVGYGSIGSRHARNLLALGHEVLVYDPVLQPSARVKFERNIYESCDAVVIATPTLHHPAGLRACVERGKHVLIEKPLARSIGGLRELLDLAKTNNAVVMMGNNLRFHPCIKQAKAWLDADEIGDPIWAHFTCASRSLHPAYLDDGVILNTGAHEVDVALHLFGPAKVLYADTVEDIIADFGLLHESGLRSTFHLDFCTPNEIREAWIVGDKEKIGIELCNHHCSLGGETVRHSGNFDDDYFNEMDAFIRRIRGEDVLGATGDDGLATLQVLLDVRKKAGLP